MNNRTVKQVGIHNFPHLLTLMVALLISCSQDSPAIEEEVETPEMPSELYEITFDAREITTRVNGGQFEMSDVINVEAYSASGELYGKELYIYDLSAIFTSSNPFTIESQTALSYAAIYPADATLDNFSEEFTFSIETNQSAYANYEQSDMLVAKVSSTSLLKPELSFYHTMSIISVNIVGADSMDDISTKLYAQTTVLCNIAEETYQGSGENSTISPYITSSGFEAIVAPQELSAGTIVVMTIGDQEYTWTNHSSSTLLSGYRYNYIWSINPTTGESNITFDGMINDWADGNWSAGDVISGETDVVDNTYLSMDSTTFGRSGENLSGSFTLGDITFEYAGVNVSTDGESAYFEITQGGYIKNTIALSNLEKIIFDEDQGDIEDLVVAAGTTLETSVVLQSVVGTSYIIPHNGVYITLSVSTDGSSVKFKTIKFERTYDDE